MHAFCRKFFTESPHDVVACPQCAAAYAEIRRIDEAVDRSAIMTGQNRGPSGLFLRSDDRLDHRGRP